MYGLSKLRIEAAYMHATCDLYYLVNTQVIKKKNWFGIVKRPEEKERLKIKIYFSVVKNKK